MSPEPTSAIERGKAAEDFALAELSKKGFRLIERNFSCKQGELDLVMMDGNELVFIEVRYRKSKDFGDGLESIDYHKQRKLRLAAETWLGKNQSTTFKGCRFDVMSISGEINHLAADWIDDAF